MQTRTLALSGAAAVTLLGTSIAAVMIFGGSETFETRTGELANAEEALLTAESSLNSFAANEAMNLYDGEGQCFFAKVDDFVTPDLLCGIGRGEDQARGTYLTLPITFEETSRGVEVVFNEDTAFTQTDTLPLGATLSRPDGLQPLPASVFDLAPDPTIEYVELEVPAEGTQAQPIDNTVYMADTANTGLIGTRNVVTHGGEFAQIEERLVTSLSDSEGRQHKAPEGYEIVAIEPISLIDKPVEVVINGNSVGTVITPDETLTVLQPIRSEAPTYEQENAEGVLVTLPGGGTGERMSLMAYTGSEGVRKEGENVEAVLITEEQSGTVAQFFTRSAMLAPESGGSGEEGSGEEGSPTCEELLKDYDWTSPGNSAQAQLCAGQADAEERAAKKEQPAADSDDNLLSYSFSVDADSAFTLNVIIDNEVVHTLQPGEEWSVLAEEEPESVMIDARGNPVN